MADEPSCGVLIRESGFDRDNVQALKFNACCESPVRVVAAVEI
jgi:hypothetical protein